MNISSFDPKRATEGHAGTILQAPVIPEGVKAPFAHAWGYLNGPGEMEEHAHHNQEVYFFFKGQGVVKVDGERAAVGPGDVVDIPKDVMHTVINESEGELLWCALWWDLIEE